MDNDQDSNAEKNATTGGKWTGYYDDSNDDCLSDYPTIEGESLIDGQSAAYEGRQSVAYGWDAKSVTVAADQRHGRGNQKDKEYVQKKTFNESEIFTLKPEEKAKIGGGVTVGPLNQELENLPEEEEDDEFNNVDMNTLGQIVSEEDRLKKLGESFKKVFELVPKEHKDQAVERDLLAPFSINLEMGQGASNQPGKDNSDKLFPYFQLAAFQTEPFLQEDYNISFLDVAVIASKLCDAYPKFKEHMNMHAAMQNPMDRFIANDSLRSELERTAGETLLSDHLEQTNLNFSDSDLEAKIRNGNLVSFLDELMSSYQEDLYTLELEDLVFEALNHDCMKFLVWLRKNQTEKETQIKLLVGLVKDCFKHPNKVYKPYFAGLFDAYKRWMESKAELYSQWQMPVVLGGLRLKTFDKFCKKMASIPHKDHTCYERLYDPSDYYGENYSPDADMLQNEKITVTSAINNAVSRYFSERNEIHPPGFGSSDGKVSVSFKEMTAFTLENNPLVAILLLEYEKEPLLLQRAREYAGHVGANLTA